MSPHRSTGLDLPLAGLLFLGAVAYLAALPRNLAPSDESYFLLEAKRLLLGEMLYRDVFWFAGPLAHWLMAGGFGVFGVTVNVARLAMAVLQGAIAVLLYLSCRRVGVRPGLALAPPLLHLAFFWSPFPYATPHWLSTLMMTATLYTLLAHERSVRPAAALLPGLCTGTLTLCHQQQGAAFAIGVTALFAIEAAIDRHSGHAGPPRTWWRMWLWYMSGIAVVAGPVILALFAIVDRHVLFEQTILHPLTGYRAYNRVWWGASTWPPYAAYTWPALLRYSPLALAPALLRLTLGWRRRRPLAELGPLATLLVIGAAAILSVSYMPDIVHIGFVAGLLFVTGAEALEATLRRLEPRPALVGVVTVILLGGTAVQLARNYRGLWMDNPFSLDTAFGRVDFRLEEEMRLIAQIDAVMADQPARVLFVYPMWASVYLTTDTWNPTPHQLLIPGYNSKGEIDETLALLEAKPPPYVLLMRFGSLGPDDRITPWIRAHYEPYESEERGSPPYMPPYTIYRRRDAAAPPAELTPRKVLP